MKETVLDHNPFFGRDMDLVPEDASMLTREIIFEKTKITCEAKISRNILDGLTILPYEQWNLASCDNTLVMGYNQVAHWANSIVMGTANSVGGYDLAGNKGEEFSITFNVNKKPNWFRRSIVKIFLGWDWIDKEEE